MNANTFDRRENSSPAYFISKYGVLKEANWDENNPPVDHKPLYWRKNPLTEEQIKDLYVQAHGDPIKFARLIELAHNING